MALKQRGAQGRLFEPPPAAPVKRRAAQTPTAARPEGWRAPSKGEEPCAVCGGSAGFGQGAAWLCDAHVPLDFFPPESRAARAQRLGGRAA